MDDNYKYIETASDLNIEGKEFYLGDVINEYTGAGIYKDEECTQLATVDELIHFYNTNDLILVGKTTGVTGAIGKYRSRVNTILDERDEQIKGCALFYNEPSNSEPGKIELIQKWSLVMEES